MRTVPVPFEPPLGAFGEAGLECADLVVTINERRFGDDRCKWWETEEEEEEEEEKNKGKGGGDGKERPRGFDGNGDVARGDGAVGGGGVEDNRGGVVGSSDGGGELQLVGALCFFFFGLNLLHCILIIFLPFR